MRAIVQRVTRAKVSVGAQVVGRCGPGLLLLVGVHRDDSTAVPPKLANKISHLRIFNDAEGKMNLCLADLAASDEPNILAISQFTVYGDVSRSRRPSFTESAPFDGARTRFDEFVNALRECGQRVETGMFGEHMEVDLTNDGPVTLIVDV